MTRSLPLRRRRRQQTSLTDGNHQTTSFAYDAKGRLKLIRYPLASGEEGSDTVRFTLYDDANRLLRRIDGRDQVTDYTYNDPGGRLTAVSYPATPSQNLTFGYDALGRRTAMSDIEGSHTYTYDGANRLRELVNKEPSGSILAAYGETRFLPTGDLASWTAAISGQATQSGTTGYVYDLQPALTEVGSIAGGMGLYGLATCLAQQVSATAVVQALAALLAALGECLATDALSGRV